MLVKIVGFGSNWWARYGRNPEDRHRYTRHAAYFNSAGVRCGSHIRRHWIVPGLVRFNGVGDFNPHFPSRSVGETFECADLAFACGGNRLLFLRSARRSLPLDYYLTVFSSARFGLFNPEHSDWKSGSALPIAVSRLRDQQEALLLMKPADWIHTELGFWRFTPANSEPLGVSFELLAELAPS
jgi:hypothetical protein